MKNTRFHFRISFLLIITIFFLAACNISTTSINQEELYGKWYTVSERDEDLFLDEWVFTSEGKLEITNINGFQTTVIQDYWLDSSATLWIQIEPDETESLGTVKFISDGAISLVKDGGTVVTLIQRNVEE
ncbi:MAG: hypothetical protein H6657_10760 [Ardenticatenaceae bacterium]|nr:hypothetical protein [Ardenticatenaceae bacterium]